jgi:hypothetical protein
MSRANPILIAAVIAMLPMLPVHAQERPAYRDFTLGSPLARVLEQVHALAPDVTLVHRRPSIIQDLRWRAPYSLGGALPQKDPVQQIVFSFYDDQLFRIAVEYDRTQTDGMTDADVTAALSERYGPALTPSRPLNASTSASQATGEWSTPVAQWADGDTVVVLLRRAFTAGFQVVVTSARIEALARVAVAESIRLDVSEAPALESARQQRNADETRLSQERSRAANKAAFRP